MNIAFSPQLNFKGLSKTEKVDQQPEKPVKLYPYKRPVLTLEQRYKSYEATHQQFGYRKPAEKQTLYQVIRTIDEKQMTPSDLHEAVKTIWAIKHNHPMTESQKAEAEKTYQQLIKDFSREGVDVMGDCQFPEDTINTMIHEKAKEEGREIKSRNVWLA
jgi:hypothetical protein